MKFIYSIALLVLSLNLLSQRSKDGAVTISTPNTIVNAYTSVTADANAGSTTVNVASSASFNVGDLVMIIQMQGARVNAQWDTVFVDPNNAMSVPNSNNIDFGSVANYHNTGNNEFAEISSIPNGTSIVLDCGLKSSYSYSYINSQGGSHTMYGKVQVIKVPRYSSLIINGGGSITCPQWNGTTGGVAVVEVENNTTLTSTPSFNVSGKGFRGGIKDNAASVFGGNKWGALNQNQGGYKGESIMGDTTTAKDYAALIGRGAIANGGGGGDAHNCGGGGGANGGVLASYNGYGNPSAGYNTQWNLEGASFSTSTSSGGGRGGYSFSNSNQSVTTKAPGNTAWNGDSRRNFGGLGGRPLDYSTGRIYLGGGGGAGDGNENQAGAGGNGGGLVYLVCYGNVSGAGTIVADGASGSSSTPGCTSNDGAGGGGGGGTIILKVNGTTALTAPTALSAVGGNGGNVVFNCGALPNFDGYGPGGSGGGGYVSSTGALPTNNVSSGTSGIQSGNSGNISTSFPPNGATKGGSGSTGAVVAYTLNTSASQTVCANQTFTVTASSTEPGTSINWYNTVVGGAAIATGTAYAAPAYTAAGTYTLFAGACAGTYRQPISITVTSGLSIAVNSPTICAGQTAVLTATSSATSYTWSTGPNTNTISVSPASTTIYTINGTASGCVGTKTTAVTVNAIPSLTVANSSICSGNSTIISATGATNYTWAPGGQITSTVSVNPTSNTIYTITGSNGSCSNTTTASVSVTPTPTLVANSTSICAGQTATLTVSGATTYTWMPGSITGTTFTMSPASNTVVTVTGANGTCTTQASPSITIGSPATITVNSPTICPNQTITLTASGATTYTWSSGPNTNTISVSPASTTVYTVSGTGSTCAGTKTTTVTVASVPSLTVANSSICSGNSTVLTASGASSYTWSPGAQTTSTVSVNPSSNTTYTISGSNGTCTNSTTASVSVTPTPTLIANSVTICPAQTATLTVSGATTYTWMPGSISGTTFTISPASNTVVTVTGANGTCTTQATASVTIGSGISISVNSATICSGQTASLTASGATTYTWSAGPNTNTLNVSPTSTTIYTISGTSGSCSGLNTATVNVIGQPTVSVANASICSGASATLTASGAASYTWSPGGQTTNGITDNPSTTTIYTITGSNGVCSNTTTSTLNVTATPTLIANSVTICPAQTATLTVSGAATYTWMPGSVTGTNYTIAPVSNTIITVTGANGTCTTQATSSVTIGSGISISVNSATICSGQTASLTASGATTYTWSAGPNTNTLNVSPSSNTTFTVTGMSGSCTGSNTAIVTVNSIPVITANSPNICSGQTATLNVNGANTYTWSNSSNGNTQTVNPSSTTIYTVSGTDINGCVAAAISSTVNVTATPTLAVASTTICAGQTATLIANGATVYNWNPGSVSGTTYTIAPVSNTVVTVTGANGTCTSSATASVTIGTGISIAVNSETICAGQTASLTASGASTYTWSTSSNSNAINVSPSSTTIYTISGSNGSCNGLNTATVTVNATPVLSVNSPSMCSDGVAGLNANGALTYTWSNGVNGSSQIVNPSTTTIYTVSGTGINGCINSTITTATVYVTTMPTVTVNSPTVCAGQTATLTASGATTYSWSTTETTSSILTTPPSTAVYAVTGGNGNCYNITTATVTVDNVTATSYSLAVSTCPTQTVALFGAGTNSASTTYTWSNGVNTYSQTVAPVNTTTYVVNGTSFSGCPALSGTVIVNVNSISANFNGLTSNTMTVGQVLNLTDNSTGATSLLWDYCDGTSTNNQITIPLTDTGSCCIKLVARNATCSDSITKCVTIVRESVVIIPNVFTPNGDNSNELFKIRATGIKNLNCAIYDRWGLKLYEWEGINGYWDGNVKTGVAPDGTYFYIVTYTDQFDTSKTEKGFLNLFRN